MARIRWRLLSTKIRRMKRRLKTETTSRDDERDWRELPSELLVLISQKLADLRYFIRFRAVCKSWRASVLVSDQPPQIPWLFECEFCEGFSLEEAFISEELCFYSLADANPETGIGRILIKECYQYYGTGNGYLLIKDGSNLSLLNPLTNNTISLPPVPSDCISIDLHSVFFSSSDLILAWCMFLACDHGNWTCGFCHPDKMKWKYIGNSYNTCCWNGMIFTTLEFTWTKVFDAASGKKLYQVPHAEEEGSIASQSYLVESCGVVLRLALYYTSDAKIYIFSVYKLSFEGRDGQPCWVKVNNIGDQILFLDARNGFSVRATAGFKENSIYYISDDWSNKCNTLWRYDIAVGTVERVPCPFQGFMWFIPKLC
ncbi:F-box protein skip23 [Rhynchospora pubera]|uniref:F-box protein skip23 n=1 Tax=Rhynchospora pubera TaxID=906938 RepID=A0AAV8EAE8_9POAL|nr:F-box protein skip23 [Rhynchospora pubera]